MVLEKSYKEYMEGFTDIVTGQARRGFVEIVKELQDRFPNPERIEKEQDKKEFAKLFGEYLKAENILQNYDEFAGLKALQSLDTSDEQAVEEFKSKYYLDDADIEVMQSIDMPSERAIQDYRSTYNDTRDWLRRQKQGEDKDKPTVDWDDVVFEIDLLKSQEINLDYILELIFYHNKKNKSKENLIEEVRRMIRGSLGNRAKESLVVDFINQTNLDEINDKASIIDAFFKFAQAEQKREADAIITSEKLNIDAAKRYIASSLKREYASENGTALNEALPKLSPLDPQYRTQKQTVFQKIAAFVEKFKGVGGQIVEIDFATGWIDDKAFESAIGKLAYQKDANKITFRFGIDCKFLLIALARFLALANQLTANGKDVVMDTTACPNTHSFFSRNGFFDYLNQSVTCLPERPVLSAAKTYRDNSDTLVELGEIAQPTQNKELVIRLGDRFVEHSSIRYFLAAKTVFSELVGNVTDHSKSKIPGLAGLQVYRPYNKPKHIQTVISDSGLGIAATLRTTLQSEHLKLYEQFSAETVENDIALVQKAFTSGEVSRFGKGRGLGFKSSREHASKEKVIIVIRQLTFSLALEYAKGQLINVSEDRGLVPITGTHICFDFYVDNF